MQRYAGGELVVVLDCADLERAAAFWTTVLGYRRGTYGGGSYLALVPQDGPCVELLLQRTSDRTSEKNRVHLDLRTADLDTEVARVQAAGGRVLTAVPVVEHGWRWHVLADPDGKRAVRPAGADELTPATCGCRGGRSASGGTCRALRLRSPACASRNASQACTSC